MQPKPISDPNTIIRFKNWVCVPRWHQYANNYRLALRLVDAVDGQPIATATVNIADEYLDENELIIKNYEENEGIVDALVKAKIIAPPHRLVKAGFQTCGVARLLIKVEL